MNKPNKPITKKDKADIVFLKLMAKLKRAKNPFDEARSITSPQINKEIDKNLEGY